MIQFYERLLVTAFVMFSFSLQKAGVGDYSGRKDWEIIIMRYSITLMIDDCVVCDGGQRR